MARTTQQETDIAPLKSTTLTDPGASAITAAIVDVYSEVIITTTAISTAQTLPTPTNTTQIKRFTITNNDTSTHTIKINNETLNVWASKYFIWDWTAWTIDFWNIIWRDLLNPLGTTSYWIPYSRNCSTLTTANFVADRLYYAPYRTKQQLIINSLSVIYTVWVAASSIALGIYDSENGIGKPTTLLATSWQMASTAGGGWTLTYNLPTPLVIPANRIIWIASACNATVTANINSVSAFSTLLWAWTTAAGTWPFTYYRETLSGGWTDLPTSHWAFTQTAWATVVVFIWLTI